MGMVYTNFKEMVTAGEEGEGDGFIITERFLVL